MQGFHIAASLGGLSVALALTTGAPVRAQTAAAPQTPYTLTLEEALMLARSDGPLLRAKGYDVAATRAGEVTAGLIPNPQLAPTLGNLGTRSPTQYSAVLSQTIELGGKRQRRLASARAGTRTATYELEDLRRQVDLQVQQAFLGVLVAQASLTLAQDHLQGLDQVERLQRLRAEKGVISELELLRIQGQRFTFERDVADARQALRAAKIGLRSIVAPARIPEVYEVAGELAYREVTVDRAALIKLAAEQRPDLEAAESALEKSLADADLARANAIPDITPQIGYTRSADNNDLSSLGFSIPLPLFDRNQGEIARTAAQVERVRVLRDALLLQVRAEVELAHAALLSARAKVLSLRDEYLPKAKIVRERSEAAYRRGGTSLLDYLDAERAYRETARTYISSLADHALATYQLEAAVGRPLH